MLPVRQIWIGLLLLLVSCEANEFKDSTDFRARDWELSNRSINLNELGARIDGSWSLRYTTLYRTDKSLIRNYRFGEIIWRFDDPKNEVYRDSERRSDNYMLRLDPVDPGNPNSAKLPVIIIDGEKGFLTIDGNKMVISYGYLNLPTYYFESID